MMEYADAAVPRIDGRGFSDASSRGADSTPATASASVSWIDTLTALSDPSLDPIFWRAERLGLLSAWWEHVPFAHWVVCATMPRVLVELGTHSGVSYAAFCQAVVRGGFATRCHAVDTWRGDPHAGVYGPEILDDLRCFHDKRFGAFSTLLQYTFDEALDHLEDGSIDLLHIDGLHTYEAVRHDFESWLPKLSGKAVVLFHDINVRSGDFGVWRLWAELREQYPAFEFVHGHGLGVLAAGAEIPAPVAALCQLADPAAIATIRMRFARLGERWCVDTRERILEQRTAAVSAEAEQLRAEVARRSREAEAARAEAAHAWKDFRAASTKASEAEQESARFRARAEHAEARALQIEVEAGKAAVRAAELGRALTQVQAERDSVLASTAWRATWPARTIGQRLPHGLRRAVRGSAKLGWWMVTMTLPRKLRERQAALRANQIMLEKPAAAELPAELPPSPLPEAAGPTAPPQADSQDAQLPFPEAVPLQATSVRSMVREHCASWAPLPMYTDRRAEPTLTVLTNSVDADLLFGDVATALVVGAILARCTRARLRLVTRHTPPDPAALGEILKAHKVNWNGATDFVHMPVGDARPLSLGRDDTVLTTSWWTTRAVLSSVNAARVLYLLQEDERMFYPHGDSRLRCAETLSEPNLRVLVSTRFLFDYLADGPDPLLRLRERGHWFEPAFPAFPRPETVRPQNGNQNFFFYARPNNDQTLYWRGLEVIDAVMRDGLLPSREWNLHFVGRELPDMELPGGVRPIVWAKLQWSKYAELVSQMDLGLCLMDTPHPSYPPLELAASGAAVVTNAHGCKKSLERWSRNIIVAPPSVAALGNALRDGVQLARDTARRFANCAEDHISRDWEVELRPVIDRILIART
jgi:hypothetical protein